jgi:hypothetical protein
MRRTAIESLLPGIFRRSLAPGNAAWGFLEVMEQLHAPSEDALADLGATFDPRRTRDAFVPLLAQWVNLDRIVTGTGDGATRAAETEPGFVRGDVSTGARGPTIRIEPGRYRELTAVAARLSRWRGTRRGLLLFLRTATGIADFEIDEQVPGKNGTALPFHIRVRAPEAAREFQALITRIIEVEKPAYVTYDLVFEGPAGAGGTEPGNEKT